VSELALAASMEGGLPAGGPSPAPGANTIYHHIFIDTR